MTGARQVLHLQIPAGIAGELHKFALANPPTPFAPVLINQLKINKLQNYYLLVDDDFDDALVFADVLKEVDEKVLFEHASNGMEALELLSGRETNLPDMIFLDLNMPRMNGKECLREIKANSRYKHIPVIIYTTSSLSADIEETFIMGATCFVTKPTSVKELKKILSTIRFTSGPDLAKALRNLTGVNSFIVC